MVTDGDAGADLAVYPMPLFVQLQVSDVERSAAWYRSLGFASVYSNLAVAHLRYRTYADLMLVRQGGEFPGGERSADRRRGSGVVVYLTLEDESVDEVAARATDLDAGSVAGPTETAWNTRELRVVDPDGYELVFAEVVDAERTFDEVMGDPSEGA
jgi:predicted lactoylglutathione lyase